MKIIIYFTTLLLTIQGFSQSKPKMFFNENGEEVSKKIFLKSLDYKNNLDLYFENDTIQYGLLIRRQGFGTLDKRTFITLKTYLEDLSETQIDSTHNIVVNYLTAYPKKEENNSQRSSWNVLDRDYLKELHKTANIKQFWISSPASDNRDYFHQRRINWLVDKENLFRKIFFPYEMINGNYLLIKPDGRFFFYLGEHGKHIIWENSEKYFSKR